MKRVVYSFDVIVRIHGRFASSSGHSRLLFVLLQGLRACADGNKLAGR